MCDRIAYVTKQHIKQKERENMKQTAIMSYWLSATTKCTSMSLGNQKGWFSNLNHAPPKIQVKKI